MIHVQVSLKLDEDTHAEIAVLASKMGISVHKFIVDALRQVLRMIGERGNEKFPFWSFMRRPPWTMHRQCLSCLYVWKS